MLAAYRNPDVGFGNALEPDTRCSDSQTADAEGALRLAFPSVKAYPRPWWSVPQDPPVLRNQPWTPPSRHGGLASLDFPHEVKYAAWSRHRT
ncbi:MAG TPA: hypothetical protein VF171_01155 [Trueperaceae bacterium]